MAMMMIVKRDALYGRYSSHAQDGNTSIDVQIERCQTAAGCELTPYIDRAKSGRAIGHRTALLRLIDDAKRGCIGEVWVYKWDRLGRNLQQTLTVIEQLDEYGVAVHSCDGSDNPLVRNIELAVAEDFSLKLAGRVYDGMVSRAQEGRWCGGKSPWGYHVEDIDGQKRLVVCEDEAAHVRWLFAERAKGVGFKRLARLMGQRGARPRGGGHWKHTTLRSMLLNPVYAGRITFNKRRYKRNRRTGRKQITWKPDSEHISYEDPTLRIVSDDVFDAVAALFGTRSRDDGKPRGGGYRRPFTGLIFCPTCGHPLYTQGSSKRFYLRCGHRLSTGGVGCDNNKSVREDLLLNRVMAVFHQVVQLDPASIIEAVAKELLARGDATRDRIDELRRTDDEITRKIDTLGERLADPELPEAGKRAVYGLLTKHQTERDECQEQLAALQDRSLDDYDSIAALTAQHLAQIQAGLKRPTNEELRDLIATFAGPMLLLPDGTLKPIGLDPEADGTVGEHMNGPGWRRQWDSNPR